MEVQGRHSNFNGELLEGMCGRDARTTWQWILETKAVTVTGDYNWFSIKDSSLLECDAVLLDESSHWWLRQYDPSSCRKLLVQSQSIISYPIFSKTDLRTSNFTWFFTCLVALVILKPMGSTIVCYEHTLYTYSRYTI